MTRLYVKFRGDDLAVIVDRYEYDPPTNALEVDWHFEHLTPAQHDALNLTEVEKYAIVEEISEYIESEEDCCLSDLIGDDG